MKRVFAFLLTLILVAGMLPAIPLSALATQTAELTTVYRIDMTGVRPAVGVDVSELMPTVDQDNVVLEEFYVRNVHTDERITEGTLETGMFYQVRYVFAPASGYQFQERGSISVYLNGVSCYAILESANRAVCTIPVNTCETFYEASLSMPVLQEGMRPEEISISVPEGAPYRLNSFRIIDADDETQEVEALQRGKKYRLRVALSALPGYTMSSKIAISCNGLVKRVNSNDIINAECDFDFSLDIGKINIAGLPAYIVEGKTIYAQQVNLSANLVNYSNFRWLDAQKQPFQAGETFQANQIYYYTFDITPKGPSGEWETLEVSAGDREATVEIVSGTLATVYVPYTPLLKIDKIQVIVNGFSQGEPVKGVAATANEHVVLSNLRVSHEGDTVTDGKIESGKVYYLGFDLRVEDGYYLDPSNMPVEVAGYEFSRTHGTDYIHISIKLNTNKTINTAKLSVSGVGVGKNIFKVKLKEASGSKFDVTNINWYTTGEGGQTFRKGDRYYMQFSLEADPGYRFSEDTSVTVSGKKAFDIETGFDGLYLYGYVEYSYVTEISKVSLPAMPKSIKPGAALPVNFKASSSAKYTLEPVWIDMNTQEPVIVADQNGCYVLSYVVMPKAGCEFTEDTVFYVDGKKVEPIVLSAYMAQIMKPYNVGLAVIDRIDLTVPEPEHGAAPGTATVAEDAPYVSQQQAWGIGKSDELDQCEEMTTFQNYKYHFLITELQAKSGYAFADTVSVFVNGDKYAVLDSINLGTAYQFAVCFGKLGEIAKLTPPELRKDGLTLYWDSVPNADAYEVYRATSKSGAYTKVATIFDTTWQESAVTKTYYYKVKAIFTPDTVKNSSYSNVISVVYKCAQPEITVQEDASGKPVISWEKVSGAKKYTVYRATSENGKYTKLSTTTKTTYTDSKATTGSIYYYKVIANASSSKYNSGYSNIVFCNVICGAPSVKIKLDSTTGKPSLSWSKVTGAVEYVIFRQLPGEETFTEIARQSAVTFLDKTAPIVTECQYQVQAVGKSEDLNSQLSVTVSATSGIAKPAAIGSINAVTGKPVITWQAVEGTVKYEIYRSTKSSKSYKLVTTVETLSYTDETVSAGKTYYYKIKAIGEVSKSADSSYVKLTGKCAQPVIQAEANETSGKPVISWEKVSGAKKYTVYRATSEGGKYTKLSTTTKLSYTDTKATAGKTYYYKVIANASSSKYNSGYSNMVSCLTHCAAPTVSVKTDAVTGKPSVSWNKVTGAVAYMVVRDGVDVCQTTNLSYKDEAAEPGKTYSYRVCALSEDQAANSSLSSSKTITATCAKPTLTGGLTPEGKPYGQWEAVEGAESYKVYRSTKKSSGYKEIALDTDGNLFFDTTAKKGKTYYYKIVAVTAGTVSAQSNYIKVKSK